MERSPGDVVVPRWLLVTMAWFAAVLFAGYALPQRHSVPLAFRDLEVGERRALRVAPGARLTVTPAGACDVVRLAPALAVLLPRATGTAALDVDDGGAHETIALRITAPSRPAVVVPRAAPQPAPVALPTPSPSAAAPAPTHRTAPLLPRLLGVMPTRSGGVALFRGRELRIGERIREWVLIEVLDDAVRMQRGNRTFRLPIVGRSVEENPERGEG